MVYIRGDGNVDNQRSPWRFSIITDFLFGVWNFISLFFASISQRTDQLHVSTELPQHVFERD